MLIQNIFNINNVYNIQHTQPVCVVTDVKPLLSIGPLPQNRKWIFRDDQL